MNRTTVLILALVLFLAHILALHQGQLGAFALPADIAHVNYQVGRNLVHGQGSVWWPGGTPAAILEEGGTSLVWTLLAAWSEFWNWSPVRTSSAVGIIAALLAVVWTARLSRSRLVGMTAMVLLVVSGPFASSAADGTETAFFTSLVVLSLLALERRRSTWLGCSLALLVLTGSLGAPLALGFLLAALHIGRTEGPPISLARSFLPPAVALGVLVVGRLSHGAPALTPDLAHLLALDKAQAMVGLATLESMVRGTIAPLLVLLPLLQLVLGHLSGTGKRALGLGLLWVLLVVLTGASDRPMHAVFVPALPLLFLSVQEAFVSGLDRRPQLEGLAWAGLSIACLGSMLASKNPGDLGPLATESALEAMAENRPALVEAWSRETSGRAHLVEDLQDGERLRALGLFLRDQVSADARILTPWPGAIGYLSRRQVVDLLGRVPGRDASAESWRGPRRVDVVEALAARPEYVVPWIESRLRPPTRDELVELLLERHDELGATPERSADLAAALEPYELVSVPIPEREADLTMPAGSPAFLLRLRSLGLSPRLSLIPDDRAEPSRVTVQVQHDGHHQIAELEVQLELTDGSLVHLRPDGRSDEGRVRARTETLLFPTGTRRVELFSLDLTGREVRRVRARLLTPMSDPDDPLSVACEPVELTLDDPGS